MGTIFGFDIKLFFSKKRNWIAMLVFLVLLFLFALGNIMLEQNRSVSQLTLLRADYTSIQEANDGIDEKTYLPKNRIEARKNREGLMEELIRSIESGEWRDELTLQIELDRLNLSETRKGHVIGYSVGELLENIGVNEILLEKNIQPVFTDVSMQSYHFMHSAFLDIIPIVMVLIVLLFSHDAISSEIDDGTVKLLLTQPVGRARIFNAKYASRLMLSLGFFALVFGVFFVILGFIKGFGNAEYPTLFYTGEYITVSDFMLLTILMAFLLIAAINAFAMLVSVLTNNTASSLSISVIVITLLYLLTYQLGLFDSIAQFNPLSYFHITELLSGEAALRFDNNGVQYINGMITLFATMFICQISASVIFNRKDIRS